MKERSPSNLSGMTAKNSGSGLGKKASVSGDPMQLGLTDRMAIAGGSAAKLREMTDDGFQAPKGSHKTVSSKGKTFQDMG